MTKVRFSQFFSVDSAKAIKAKEFGWLNGINYMNPAKTRLSSGKVVNLCPNAGACELLCLGKYSGQAAMLKDLENGTNSVRRSRVAKVEYFMTDRQGFMNEASLHIARKFAWASRKGFKLCIRMNGATDTAYEGIGFVLTPETAKAINRALKGSGYSVNAGIVRSIYGLFPWIQFVDYTKLDRRFDRKLPSNLHLTFSRAEDNESKAVELLGRGVNVAVVFADRLPTTWHGFPVINGDDHDLRHLDPKGGYVIGLLPKGNKAKKDTSGFVVRDYEESRLAA